MGAELCRYSTLSIHMRRPLGCLSHQTVDFQLYDDVYLLNSDYDSVMDNTHSQGLLEGSKIKLMKNEEGTVATGEKTRQDKLIELMTRSEMRKVKRLVIEKPPMNRKNTQKLLESIILAVQEYDQTQGNIAHLRKIYLPWDCPEQMTRIRDQINERLTILSQPTETLVIPSSP